MHESTQAKSSDGHSAAPACDCYLHEQQVCDVCQGIDPANPPKDVEPSAACTCYRENPSFLPGLVSVEDCPKHHTCAWCGSVAHHSDECPTCPEYDEDSAHGW